MNFSDFGLDPTGDEKSVQDDAGNIYTTVPSFGWSIAGREFGDLWTAVMFTRLGPDYILGHPERMFPTSPLPG